MPATTPQLLEAQVEKVPRPRRWCSSRAPELRRAQRTGQPARSLPHRPGHWPGEPGRATPPSSLEMVVALVGILKSGAAYVPDPQYPPERAGVHAGRMQARPLITTGSWLASCPLTRRDYSPPPRWCLPPRRRCVWMIRSRRRWRLHRLPIQPMRIVSDRSSRTTRRTSSIPPDPRVSPKVWWSSIATSPDRSPRHSRGIGSMRAMSGHSFTPVPSTSVWRSGALLHGGRLVGREGVPTRTVRRSDRQPLRWRRARSLH